MWWVVGVTIFLAVASPVAGWSGAVEITPPMVFAEAERIEQEVALLSKATGGDDQPVPFQPVEAELLPRHSWEKSYFVLIKLNIFRTHHHLPSIPPNAMEPVRSLDPALVYEQTQRILTEIAIIKKRLGITETVPVPTLIPGKRPIDVFNKLHQASLALDRLNGEPIRPSYLFSEVMRIHEDVSAIMRHLDIEDTSFPPAKVRDVTPRQTLDATFLMMRQIQQLQAQQGIALTDFGSFAKVNEVFPSDILNMEGMCLAELQPLKAVLQLTGVFTPKAHGYEGKNLDDVHQLLLWTVSKLRLIQAME